MGEQNGKQVVTLQRPTTNDSKTWKKYWEAQGQLWRTEPEIDTERQKYLAERGTIVPDIEQGIYPFKDIKLSRADVEWLLTTHENGGGPVDWKDESQRKRTGIDIRGAILRTVDLSDLPLSRIYGALTVDRWFATTSRQRDMAAAHLEGAILRRTHLEEADLSGIHLEKAILTGAFMEQAYLVGAHLEGARLLRVNFKSAFLFLRTQMGPTLRMKRDPALTK